MSDKNSEELSLRDVLSASYEDEDSMAAVTPDDEAEDTTSAEDDVIVSDQGGASKDAGANSDDTGGEKAGSDKDKGGEKDVDDAENKDGKADKEAVVDKDQKDDKKEDSTSASKPPASWTPTSKAEWDKVPSAVQEQVNKREREVATALQESSQARNFAGSFSEMIKPFAPMLQQSNVHPLKYIQDTLGVAMQLQAGNTSQKASTVARLIQDYGVDVKELDGILSGKKQPANVSNRQPANAALPPEVADKIAKMEAYINNDTQTKQQQIASETQQFLDNHEFADDVRNEMADFMDVAQAQGRTMSLKEAYERALTLRPDLQKRLQAKQQQNNTEGKKRASASVASKPKPQIQPGKPEDMRGVLEQAWDENSA